MIGQACKSQLMKSNQFNFNLDKIFKIYKLILIIISINKFIFQIATKFLIIFLFYINKFNKRIGFIK